MASKGPKKKTSSTKSANSKGSVSGTIHDPSKGQPTTSSKGPSTRSAPSSKGSSTGPPPTLNGPLTRSIPVSNGPSTRSRKVNGTVTSTVTGTAPAIVKPKN